MADRRARVISALALASLVVAGVAYVPSVLAGLSVGQPWVVVLDTVALGWAAVLVLLRKRHPRAVAAQLLIILYSIGAIFLVVFGPLSAGPYYLFAVPPLAAAMLGLRASIAALVIDALTIGLAGLLLELGVVQWPYLEPGPIWWMLAGSFVFLDALVAVSVATLIRGLEASLRDNLRLAEALERANELIAIADDERRVRWVNAAFARTVGDRIGRPLADAIGAAERSGTFTSSVEHEGRARTIAWTVTPLDDVAGHEHLIVGRDITHETMLSKQLAQAQKLEAVGTLAGGIAHDLNNMLHPVISSAELLEDQVTTAESRALVGEVLSAARRARDVVRRILRFTTRRSGAVERIDLAQALPEEVRLVAAVLPPETSLELAIDPAATDVGVRLDGSALSQVMLSLCTNAAQAMEPAGGTIRVALRVEPGARAVARCPELDASRRYAVLEVIDHGRGIPPEMIDHVFDPFFTTKSSSEGSGLGLTNVHRIVQGANGAIAVESAVDRGSAFRLYVPIEEAERIEAAPVASERRGTRVLVIDDDDGVRRAIGRTLARLDVQVVSHSRGAQALAELRARPDDIDLVISDLTMPEMTGLDVADEVRRIRADLPILLLTGRDDGDLAESAARRGVAEVLLKPLERSELARALERHVPRERAKRTRTSLDKSN